MSEIKDEVVTFMEKIDRLNDLSELPDDIWVILTAHIANIVIFSNKFDELTDFRDNAFNAHPNIDIDIEALK